MKPFTVEQIAEKVGGVVKGVADVAITGIEQIEKAGAGELTFIGNSKYAKKWADSKASAALVSKGVEVDPGDRTIIEVDSADLAVALVLELFAPEPPKAAGGVHATAVVDESAELGAGVSVGPGSYIGPGVKIGDGCILHANVSVMDEAEIGLGSVIWPGAVIREKCVLGAGCIIHINVAIGADGFGYRPSLDGKSIVKIPQIGNVVIGNGVEIGANSCVDRGKFSSTVIGDLVKIDNLCQIGHNCDIGAGTVIASSTAIAGSTAVGMFCQIGGCVAIVDHATIGNQVKIGGGSGVIGDIADGQTVLGYPAGPAKATVQQWAYMKKLPELVRKLKKG